MKAIIPAAGIGERLKPLTLTKPKVLLPVAGKPIIGHIYDRIIQSGISDVTVIIGYRGQQVLDYSCANYHLNFRFIEQTKRRGLGHAVGLGLEETNEPVLILLGDTILDLNFPEFAQKSDNTIGVMTVKDPRRFGIVELQDGWIARLVEKPQETIGNLAIAGIYLIKDQSKLKSAIDYIINHNIITKGEFQLTDALQVMVNRGERIKTEMISSCHDCGTPESLLTANRLLLANSNRKFKEYPNSVIIPPVYIHDEADIRESVIGPYVSIGEGTKIIGSVVSNSIITENAHIQSAVLKNSLIGTNASVKGRTIAIDLGDFSHQEMV